MIATSQDGSITTDDVVVVVPGIIKQTNLSLSSCIMESPILMLTGPFSGALGWFALI